MAETVHTTHTKKGCFVAVRLTDGELRALDSIQAVEGFTSRSEALRQAIVTRYKTLNPVLPLFSIDNNGGEI